MSCQLNLFANFHDISKVRNFLCPSLKEDSPQPQASREDALDGWDEDWGSWNEEGSDKEDEEESPPKSDDNNRHQWLQDCILSLSPANDIIAVSHLDRCVLLSQKFDKTDKEADLETKFTTVWEGSFRQEENETVTAIMCLPLASQKRSTQGAPDWSCIVVGFSSGYIRMYTETGILLLSQLLHSEPVQKIKCRTYEPPRYLGISEQNEELVILFRRALVTIDGFSLFQSLRACRNQLARATASGSDSVLQPPPLAYKKWGLQEQEKILDISSCGTDTPNPFDHMKTTSILGGPSATVRPTPPAAGLFVTSGIGHYVGFFYAIEGSTQPILSDVAYAVAHKLKSAIMSAASGWLGFGGKQKEEQKRQPKIEPAAPLSLRFGLPDKRRQGDSIYLSPNNNYVATTDSFGRITLIDIEKGIAVRMWKGYRDAQLGWVQVREDSHHSNQNPDQLRVAQFLVIYAPRRGILEVWTAASGPRVAAFNVSKFCKLVCPSYGMMGLNNVTSRGIKNKAFQCALIDPCGNIKTLDVPFHLALSDTNSKRARDLHLLKKLKMMLKDNSEESADLESCVKNLLLDMKISNIMQQGTERVLSTKYLSSAFLQNVLKYCIDSITSRGEDGQDIDSKLLMRYCQLQSSLLDTYDLLNKSRIHKTDKVTDLDPAEMSKSLELSSSECTHIVSQLESYVALERDTTEKKVRFQTAETYKASDFLSTFQCQPHLSDQDSNRHRSVTLSERLSEDKRLALGKFIFRGCVEDDASVDKLAVVIQDCNLSPGLLLDLLIQLWLSTDARTVPMMLNLHRILSVLSRLTDKSNVLADSQDSAAWWQKIRYSCCHSNNVQAAYLLAVACRSVGDKIIRSQTKAKDPDADTATEEQGDHPGEQGTVSMDTEQWNLLVKQLEDVMSISSLLHLGNNREDPMKVSVSKILEGGRGSISELVACFLSKSKFHPADLYRTNMVDSVEQMEIVTEGGEKSGKSVLELVQGQLISLQQRFPHSLENDVLLCNCCWENAVQWNKDLDSVNNLECSIEYLKLVQNALLRHGVSVMLWSMFVSKRFSATAQLMEKVGKVPKDRLCRKDIGVSEANLSEFVSNVVQLLTVLMEANCEINEVPVFNIEPNWQGVRGPSSLVELAIDKKMTNYGLIRHHYQLSLIMHAVLVFNMKSVKVISLFDSKGKHAFFNDFTQHPLLPSQNVDLSLSSNRKQFCARVLTCAVQQLDSAAESEASSLSPPPSPANSPTSSPSKHKRTNKWPAIVQELVKDFGLDLDFFKRHHVYELYSGGHDREAEEVLLTVNDHEQMGSQLLLLAGYRVAYYLLESHKMKGVELLTNVSPVLSTWLKSLEKGHLRKSEVPVPKIAMLVHHVANNLPEGYHEYELAIELVDLVQSMS